MQGSPSAMSVTCTAMPIMRRAIRKLQRVPQILLLLLLSSIFIGNVRAQNPAANDYPPLLPSENDVFFLLLLVPYLLLVVFLIYQVVKLKMSAKSKVPTILWMENLMLSLFCVLRAVMLLQGYLSTEAEQYGTMHSFFPVVQVLSLYLVVLFNHTWQELLLTCPIKSALTKFIFYGHLATSLATMFCFLLSIIFVPLSLMADYSSDAMEFRAIVSAFVGWCTALIAIVHLVVWRLCARIMKVKFYQSPHAAELGRALTLCTVAFFVKIVLWCIAEHSRNSYPQADDGSFHVFLVSYVCLELISCAFLAHWLFNVRRTICGDIEDISQPRNIAEQHRRAYLQEMAVSEKQQSLNLAGLSSVKLGSYKAALLLKSITVVNVATFWENVRSTPEQKRDVFQRIAHELLLLDERLANAKEVLVSMGLARREDKLWSSKKYKVFSACRKVLVLCACLYFTIVPVLRAAFVGDEFHSSIIFDFLLDVVVLFEWLGRMFVFPYTNSAQELVSGMRGVFAHYRGQSKILILTDIIVCIPWWLSGFANGWSGVYAVHTLSVMIAFRLPQAAYDVLLLTQYADLYSRPRGKVLTLFCRLYLGAHVIACLWWSLGRELQSQGEANWIEYYRDRKVSLDITTADSATQYIASLHFSLVSVVGLGYGDIVAINRYEVLFAVAVMIYGFLTMGSIIGNLVPILLSNTERFDTYHRVGNNALKLIRRYAPPEMAGSLVQMTQRYRKYIWDRQHGVHEDELLNNGIPDLYRMQLVAQFTLPILSSIVFLQDTPQGMIRGLIQSLHSEIFSGRDNIILRGQVGSKLYLVVSGSVEVLDTNENTVVGVIPLYSYFGENTFLDPREQVPFTVRAVGFTNVFSCSTPDWLKLIPCYPDYLLTQHTEARKNLRRRKLEMVNKAIVKQRNVLLKESLATDLAELHPDLRNQVGDPAAVAEEEENKNKKALSRRKKRKLKSQARDYSKQSMQFWRRSREARALLETHKKFHEDQPDFKATVKPRLMLPRRVSNAATGLVRASDSFRGSRGSVGGPSLSLGFRTSASSARGSRLLRVSVQASAPATPKMNSGNFFNTPRHSSTFSFQASSVDDGRIHLNEIEHVDDSPEPDMPEGDNPWVTHAADNASRNASFNLGQGQSRGSESSSHVNMTPEQREANVNEEERILQRSKRYYEKQEVLLGAQFQLIEANPQLTSEQKAAHLSALQQQLEMLKVMKPIQLLEHEEIMLEQQRLQQTQQMMAVRVMSPEEQQQMTQVLVQKFNLLQARQQMLLAQLQIQLARVSVAAKKMDSPASAPPGPPGDTEDRSGLELPDVEDEQQMELPDVESSDALPPREEKKIESAAVDGVEEEQGADNAFGGHVNVETDFVKKLLEREAKAQRAVKDANLHSIQFFKFWRPTSLKYLANINQKESLYADDNQESDALVLVPDDMLRYIWGVIYFCVTCYTAIAVPLRCALVVRSEVNDFYYLWWFWLAIDWLTDIVFWMDIAFRLQYFALVLADGQLIRERSQFRKIYLKSGFVLDLLVTLPWELLFLPSNMGGMAFARLFRLVHLRRLHKSWHSLMKVIGVNPTGMSNRLRVVVYAVFLFHVCACMWVTVSDVAAATEESWESVDVIGNSDTRVRYLRAFYFCTVSLLTVGYGDIVPVNGWEIFFSVLFNLIASALYIFLVSFLTSTATSANARSALTQERVELVNSVLQKSSAHIPTDVRESISSYFAALQKMQEGYTDQFLLEQLPEHIRVAFLSAITRRQFFHKMAIFDGAETGMLNALSLKLRLHTYREGDVMLEMDTPLTRAIFVIAGEVTVLSDSRRSLTAVRVTDQVLGHGHHRTRSFSMLNRRSSRSTRLAPSVSNAGHRESRSGRGSRQLTDDAADDAPKRNMKVVDMVETGDVIGQEALLRNLPIVFTYVASSNVITATLFRADLDEVLGVAAEKEEDEEEKNTEEKLSEMLISHAFPRGLKQVLQQRELLETKLRWVRQHVNDGVLHRSDVFNTMVSKKITRTKTSQMRLQQLMETITSAKLASKGVIYSNNPKRVLWELVGVLLMLYYAVIAPYRAAFYSLEPDLHFSVFADVVVDLMLVIDVVLRLWKFSNHEHTIGEIPAVFWEYVSRRDFVLDVLGTGVWDYFLLLLAPNYFPFYVVRCARLLRLHRVSSYRDSISGFVKNHGYHITGSFFSIVSILLSLLFMTHWMACLWNLLATWQTWQGEVLTWHVAADARFAISDSPRLSRFMQSLYFLTVTISTVGYGDIRPTTVRETALGLAIIIVGGLLYGVVIGNFATLASNYDVTAASFNKKMQSLSDFLSYRKFSTARMRVIKSHYYHLWQDSKGVAEREIFNELSDMIQSRVYRCLYMPLMKAISIFKNLDVNFLQGLCACVNKRWYAAGTAVINTNDLSNCLYILQTGIAVRTSRDKKAKSVFTLLLKTIQQRNKGGGHTPPKLGSDSAPGMSRNTSFTTRHVSRFGSLAGDNSLHHSMDDMKLSGLGMMDIQEQMQMDIALLEMEDEGGVDDLLSDVKLSDVVQNGSVKRQVEENERRWHWDQSTPIISTGAVFGEQCWNRPYPTPQMYSVRAVTDCYVLSISEEDVRPLFYAYPEIAKELKFQLHIKWVEYSKRFQVLWRIRKTLGRKVKRLRQRRQQGSKRAERGEEEAVRSTSAVVSPVESVVSMSTSAHETNGVEMTLPGQVSKSHALAAARRADPAKKRGTLLALPNETLLAFKRKMIVILPTSMFRLTWDCVACLGVLFYCIVIPTQVAFFGDFDSGSALALWILSWTLDLFFVVDFSLHALLFVQDSDNQSRLEALTPRDVARAFFKSNIFSAIVSFLAILPYDLFYLAANPDDAQNAAVWRLTHFLLLIRTASYLKSFNLMLDRVFRIDIQSRKLMELFVGIVVLLHAIVCFWISLATNAPPGERTWQRVGKGGTLQDLTDGWLYVYGVYWGVATVTTTGYGDISATSVSEMALVLATVLLSAVATAAIIGTIALRAEHKHSQTADLERQLRALKFYMTSRDVSTTLRGRILDYYNYVSSNNTILMDKNLPRAFQREICAQIYKPLKAALEYAVQRDDGFLNAFSRLLKPELYLPAEIVIKKGDMALRMYFIHAGQCQVILENAPDKVIILKEGRYFGEIAILLPSQVRTSSIMSLSVLELLSVTRNDWAQLMASYPQRGINIKKAMLEEINYPDIDKDALLMEEFEMKARLDAFLKVSDVAETSAIGSDPDSSVISPAADLKSFNTGFNQGFPSEDAKTVSRKPSVRRMGTGSRKSEIPESGKFKKLSRGGELPPLTLPRGRQAPRASQDTSPQM